MIVITGPSGSGKTTLRKALVREGHCSKAVTATTRKPRHDETNGIDYHFLSKEQFQALVNKGKFVEHVSFAGNCYGLPKASIADTDMTYVAELELTGANYLKETRGDVFIVHLDIQNTNISPKRTKRDLNVDWSTLISDIRISSFNDIDIQHIMAEYHAKNA